MTPNSLVLFADVTPFPDPSDSFINLFSMILTLLIIFYLTYALLPIKSKVVKITAASIIPIILVILLIEEKIKDNHVDHPKPYGLYQFMPENELKED